MLEPNKNIIFSCSHCSCNIFILTSQSLYIQVKLISIFINVHYLQQVVFSFEKGLNGQYHSSSGSHYLIKISPSKISDLHPLQGGDFPATTKCYLGNSEEYMITTLSLTSGKFVMKITRPNLETLQILSKVFHEKYFYKPFCSIIHGLNVKKEVFEPAFKHSNLSVLLLMI